MQLEVEVSSRYSFEEGIHASQSNFLAALDPKSSQVVMQLADKINKELGITIVLVTHSMKDALQYGNRLLMFHGGSIMRDLNKPDKSQLQLSSLQAWFS